MVEKSRYIWCVSGENAPPEGDDPGVATIEKSEVKTKQPPLYKVFLHNDDYTPMEFVVDVLIRFFRKNKQESTAIMLSVHERGVGVCGVFTREIAETKVMQVRQAAKAQGHPLKCSMEAE